MALYASWQLLIFYTCHVFDNCSNCQKSHTSSSSFIWFVFDSGRVRAFVDRHWTARHDAILLLMQSRTTWPYIGVAWDDIFYQAWVNVTLSCRQTTCHYRSKRYACRTFRAWNNMQSQIEWWGSTVPKLVLSTRGPGVRFVISLLQYFVRYRGINMRLIILLTAQWRGIFFEISKWYRVRSVSAFPKNGWRSSKGSLGCWSRNWMFSKMFPSLNPMIGMSKNSLLKRWAGALPLENAKHCCVDTLSEWLALSSGNFRNQRWPECLVSFEILCDAPLSAANCKWPCASIAVFSLIRFTQSR